MSVQSSASCRSGSTTSTQRNGLAREREATAALALKVRLAELAFHTLELTNQAALGELPRREPPPDSRSGEAATERLREAAITSRRPDAVPPAQPPADPVSAPRAPRRHVRMAQPEAEADRAMSPAEAGRADEATAYARQSARRRESSRPDGSAAGREGEPPGWAAYGAYDRPYEVEPQYRHEGAPGQDRRAAEVDRQQREDRQRQDADAAYRQYYASRPSGGGPQDAFSSHQRHAVEHSGDGGRQPPRHGRGQRRRGGGRDDPPSDDSESDEDEPRRGGDRDRSDRSQRSLGGLREKFTSFKATPIQQSADMVKAVLARIKDVAMDGHHGTRVGKKIDYTGEPQVDANMAIAVREALAHLRQVLDAYPPALQRGGEYNAPLLALMIPQMCTDPLLARLGFANETAVTYATHKE